MGRLFGHPASGRVVTLTAIPVYRIADGRIVERWVEQGSGVLQQLGLDVPPAGEPRRGAMPDGR